MRSESGERAGRPSRWRSTSASTSTKVTGGSTYGGVGVQNAIGYYPGSLFGTGQMVERTRRTSLYGGETVCKCRFLAGHGQRRVRRGRVAAGGLPSRNIFYCPPGGGAQWATLTAEQPSPACYTIEPRHGRVAVGVGCLLLLRRTRWRRLLDGRHTAARRSPPARPPCPGPGEGPVPEGAPGSVLAGDGGITGVGGVVTGGGEAAGGSRQRGPAREPRPRVPLTVDPLGARARPRAGLSRRPRRAVANLFTGMAQVHTDLSELLAALAPARRRRRSSSASWCSPTARPRPAGPDPVRPRDSRRHQPDRLRPHRRGRAVPPAAADGPDAPGRRARSRCQIHGGGGNATVERRAASADRRERAARHDRAAIVRGPAAGEHPRRARGPGAATATRPPGRRPPTPPQLPDGEDRRGRRLPAVVRRERLDRLLSLRRVLPAGRAADVHRHPGADRCRSGRGTASPTCRSTPPTFVPAVPANRRRAAREPAPPTPPTGSVSTYVDRVPVEQPISVDGFRDQIDGPRSPTAPSPATRTRRWRHARPRLRAAGCRSAGRSRASRSATSSTRCRLRRASSSRSRSSSAPTRRRCSRASSSPRSRREEQSALGGHLDRRRRSTPPSTRAVHGSSSFQTDSDSLELGRSASSSSSGGGGSSSSSGTSSAVAAGPARYRAAARRRTRTRRRRTRPRRGAAPARTGMRAGDGERVRVGDHEDDHEPQPHARADHAVLGGAAPLRRHHRDRRADASPCWSRCRSCGSCRPGQPPTLTDPSQRRLARRRCCSATATIVKHRDVLAQALPRRYQHGLTRAHAVRRRPDRRGRRRGRRGRGRHPVHARRLVPVVRGRSASPPSPTAARASARCSSRSHAASRRRRTRSRARSSCSSWLPGSSAARAATPAGRAGAAAVA